MKFNEDKVFLLRREDIQSATDKNYRQYFCGNLRRPQLLDYIPNGRLRDWNQFL